MKILQFLLTSTFAQNFNALSPGNDPDAAMTMFKEIYFPIFKASFTNLDHDKMHRQKAEDVGEMRFVERMFDYCVGEDDYFMSFEEDLACGTRMLTDMSKAFPELAELVEEDDPELNSMVYEILDVNGDGGMDREEYQDSVYCAIRVMAAKFVQFAPPDLKENLVHILSSFAETIPTLLNNEEMESFMSGHPRIYRIIKQRFNEKRLGKLFRTVDFNNDDEICERELTKFAINLLDEFSDLAELISDETDY
ncbi:Oidioi.mRNA.OKI2018_I69.chr2.g6194.t1.cds [Oikopleura dioica]|uniref:Oidioi.mRNA.OKI2018_I69.chr2.g6194.t1.cds n=1 Tax=Oikopleura dioica TaxID=34765 RepID=A0ABN7TBM5_OIKDI|nr:Oidioi.mRNA.OKI2018_I69.chr2.g6194.t1.cds [Oikopleura dioica]